MAQKRQRKTQDTIVELAPQKIDLLPKTEVNPKPEVHIKSEPQTTPETKPPIRKDIWTSNPSENTSPIEQLFSFESSEMRNRWKTDNPDIWVFQNCVLKEPVGRFEKGRKIETAVLDFHKGEIDFIEKISGETHVTVKIRLSLTTIITDICTEKGSE